MKNKKLIKKIVEILADYKFNSTCIETTEMTAERIINIVKEDVIELIDEFMPLKPDNKKHFSPYNNTWKKRLEELKERIEG